LIGLAANIHAQIEQKNTSGGMVTTVSSVSNGPEIGLYQLVIGK